MKRGSVIWEGSCHTLCTAINCARHKNYFCWQDGQSGAQNLTRSGPMVQFEAFLVGERQNHAERTDSSCTELAGKSVCTQRELPGCLDLAEVQFFFFLSLSNLETVQPTLKWPRLTKSQKMNLIQLSSHYLTSSFPVSDCAITSGRIYFFFFFLSLRNFHWSKSVIEKGHFQLGRICFGKVNCISPYGMHMVRQL